MLNVDTAAGWLDNDKTDLSSRFAPAEYLILGPPVPNAWLTTALANASLLPELEN